MNHMTLIHWILVIIFGILGIICLYVVFQQFRLTKKTRDDKERLRHSIMSGFVGGWFALIILVIIGIFQGLPITSISCWSFLIFSLCLIVPFQILFSMGAYGELWSQEKYKQLSELFVRNKKDS